MERDRRFRFPQFMAGLSSILLLACSANTVFGQTSNGSVRGVVRDQTGAVIPGAAVGLTNVGTNITLSSTSNDAGLYVFGSVIPGKYTLKVSSAGMETQQVNLEVQVQTSTAYDPVLKPGSTGTTVTVSADVTPMVVQDGPALGHVLERQRIEQLPINGRDIQNLLVTVPGVEVNNNANATNQVRSFGMQAGSHQYILDGAVLEESMWNEGSIYAAPSLDTIQEFKVENNSSSAKYTRMTSIVMSTKSGTNQLHGTLFETNRNNSYGKARTRQDYGAFPELSRNEFGGTLGGPVYIPGIYNGKDRTFFFTSFEGRRFTAPNSMTGRVPTAAMRNGDFSGLLDSQGRLTKIYDPMTTDTNTWTRQQFNYGGKANVIDPQRISPLAKYAFSVIPMPTFPDRNPMIEDNWFGSSPNDLTGNTITERIDHRFSSKDQAYGRFNYGSNIKTLGLGCPPATDGVGCIWKDNDANYSLATNWVHIVSPTLFNEVMVSWAHTARTQNTGEVGKDYIDPLGVPNPFKQTGFPYLRNVGLSPTNYLAPTNYFAEQHSYWIVEDNATKLAGKHEIQFGAHLRYDRLDTVPQLVGNTGRVDFGTLATALYDPESPTTSPLASPLTGSNLANMFLGVANYEARLRKGLFKLRRPEYAFYFQDNVKLTPRLTLNLGVRYQLTPFTGEADQVTIPGFDRASHSIVLSQPLDKLYARGVTLPSVVQAFENIGVQFKTWDQVGLPQKMAYDNWHDWGPHVGAAYRFSDGPKSMVLRGGVSKSFYDEGTWVWMDQSAGATPFSANFQNTSLTSAEQSPDGIRYYGMRSVPTIIAGKNSQDAVNTNTLGGISAGNTYNYFFNPHQPTNYVWDYNLTVEKEILSDTIFRVGFVGNHAGNQSQAFPFNDPTPAYIWYQTTGQDIPGGPLAAVARNPYDSTTYGPLVEYRKTGYSNFNGAQFVFERRHSKGIAFQIAYVVGNAFRFGPGDSFGGYTNSVADVNQYLPGTVPTDADQRNRMLNYARDSSYPKHKIRWNFLVDLPFGRGKVLGHNAGGVLNQMIGGWQVAGLGSLGSTYLPLTSSNFNFTGEPLKQYGYKYKIQDCRSGTCYPGYLWYNGYIPANQINSHDEAGNPNGVMGVPADYKPAVTPLIPWGSTTLPANAPADTNVADYWDTNTVWVPLKEGTARTDYAPGLNAWQNQFIPGPLQWNQDLSLFKRFRLRESTEVRFTFDAFNVFNHPNNDQNSVLGDGIMNTSYQANVGRELQLSVRLTW